MGSLFIAGMGHHHPDERVTNADLARLVDTSDEWIRRKTGIVERRRAPRGANAADLGALATERALATAGWSAADLDLLVCATSTSDKLIPPAACELAFRLGVHPVAFDVNAACAGFAYALEVARGLMAGPHHRRAALCCAENYTRYTDYGDRASCIMWGDGAATVLLQKEEPARGVEVVDTALQNWHRGSGLVYLPVGGHVRFDGPKVKDHALDVLARSATAILERNRLRPSDLRAFMGHQANYRLLETVASRLGIDEDRHWSNVRMMGNQGAAGVLTTFCAGVEKHADSLEDGDLFLLTMIGAGYTIGSVLLRWTSNP